MHPWRARLSAVFHSLSFRLTLVSLLVLVLGMTVLTVLLIRQAERDLLRALEDREIQDVAETAAVLSRRIVDRQRALADAVGELPEPLLRSDAQLGDWLSRQRALAALFQRVFVADIDGDVRLQLEATAISHPSINISDRDYFQQALRTRRPVISEALSVRPASAPVVVVGQALLSGPQVIGFIGGTQSLLTRNLVADLVDAGDSDGNGQLVVTDGQGLILAHHDAAKVLTRLEDDRRFAPAVADWRRQGAAIEPAGLRIQHPDDLVIVAGVAGPDWLVWRRLPKAVVVAPLLAARHEAVVQVSALVLLLAIGLLGVFIRLLRPLSVLRQRARHLFDLHPAADTVAWPEDASEIGELARVLRHVSAERSRFEARNQQVMKQLLSVMAAAPVGIAFTRQHHYELVSSEFCRLLDRPQASLLGQHTGRVYSADQDYAQLLHDSHAAFERGQAYLGEWRLERGDGSQFWAEVRGCPVDMNDLAGGTIWTLSDISQRVAERAQLSWSASHDALTGLANRRGFVQRLQQLLTTGTEHPQAEVMVIDLDHFKPINDQAGHAAGDAMLQAVAQAISSQVRAADLVVRTGGDEFAVLLEGCSHEIALRLATQVRLAICAVALPWQGQLMRVGASLGVASWQPGLAGVDNWLAAADAACYAAKAAGRGQVHSAQLGPVSEVSVTSRHAVDPAVASMSTSTPETARRDPVPSTGSPEA